MIYISHLHPAGQTRSLPTNSWTEEEKNPIGALRLNILIQSRAFQRHCISKQVFLRQPIQEILVSGFTKSTKNAGITVMPDNTSFHYTQSHLDKYGTLQRHSLILPITEHTDILTKKK